MAIRCSVCCRDGVLLVESPYPAVDLVKTQGSINPLPKIVIANGYPTTKAFPTPIMPLPLTKSAANATRYVLASCNERDSRWSVQRFQSADDCQELSSAGFGFGLCVFRDNPFAAINRLQRETPRATFCAALA